MPPRTDISHPGALALVLLLACSSAGAAGEQVSRRTMTIGDDEGARFSSIAGISVDAAGCLYVTDQLEYAVKKFDSRGRFLGKTGSRGTAPGRFTSPGLSAVMGDRLLVLQTRDPRIEVFDSHLAFMGEFVVPGGMPVDMAASRSLAVALYSDSAAGSVMVYGGAPGCAPGRLLPGGKGGAHPLFAVVRIAQERDGGLVMASLFRNNVEIYTPRGKLLRRFSVPQMRSRGEAASLREIPSETYFRKVVVDARGAILLLGGTMSPHPGRDIFAYRSDGRYLRTYLLPEKTRLIAAGGPGVLFATDASGTHLLRYSLESRTTRGVHR